MNVQKEILNTKALVWFSRSLRWALGIFLIWIGFHFEDAWPVKIFGAVVFATGFLRPRRCIDETCTMPDENQGNAE
jgi:hypothetical protein